MAYLTIRPLWPCIPTKFSAIYPFWSCLIYNLYVMIHICPGTVFQWKFNGGIYFHTRLTNFVNFLILHICIWFIHHFSTQIQWSPWLCNHEGVWSAVDSFLHSTGMPSETILLHYMIWIWISLECIFQFAFKYNRVSVKTDLNTFYDCHTMYFSLIYPFNSMWIEKSILMMPISYIVIILFLMLK